MHEIYNVTIYYYVGNLQDWNVQEAKASSHNLKQAIELAIRDVQNIAGIDDIEVRETLSGKRYSLTPEKLKKIFN